MPHITVSVVSPVYNAEPYLRECLDSLVAQTLPGIEFICIDDGSTDGSLAILNEYADRDRRFRIVTKPNAGYGNTMNLGMDLARGEYVGFLDPDDFTEPHTYQALYDRAREMGRPDIVKANFYRYSSEHGDVFAENYGWDLCEGLMSITEEPGIRAIRSTPTIWAGIYRVEFLRKHNLRLSETSGVSHQDTAFVLKAWIATESFAFLHDALHHYRIDNPGSSAYASGNVFRVCDEFDEADRFLEQSGRFEALSGILAERRFSTYEWNCRRLRDREREEFVIRASADFKRLLDEGRLQRCCFEKAAWDRALLLIERPMEYYARRTYGDGLQAARRTIATQQAREAQQEQQLAENAQAINDLQEMQSNLERQMDQLNQRLESSRAELKEQKQRLKACKQNLASKKEALTTSRQKLKAQKAQTARYKDLAAKRKEELRKIRRSKSYRIGHACTWLPRKIKRTGTK